MDSSLGFPEEVLVEILLKLPIKTIVSFGGVCKSWYKLITDPSFISLHLKKSALEHGKAYTLVRRCSSTSSREYYSLHSDDDNFGVCTEFECGFPCLGDFFRVIGTCNGLICISDDQRTNFQTITLWNPIIKKAVHLPHPNVVSATHSLGFGFDPITKDYKVVRIAYRRDFGEMRQPGYGQKEVEVYNLSSGTWRNMGDLPLPLVVGIRKSFSLERQDSPVFINGAVHWTAYRYSQEGRRMHYSVVSFDMQLDTFKEMPLPETLAVIDSSERRELTIWECKQMLSVAVHDLNLPSCSIWTLKEYNVAESWTKLFDIDIRGMAEMARFIRPLGFRRRGELLFENEDRFLISYEHEGSPKLKNLQISSSKRFKHRSALYVDNYTESLVFLDRGASKVFDIDTLGCHLIDNVKELISLPCCCIESIQRLTWKSVHLTGPVNGQLHDSYTRIVDLTV